MVSSSFVFLQSGSVPGVLCGSGLSGVSFHHRPSLRIKSSSSSSLSFCFFVNSSTNSLKSFADKVRSAIQRTIFDCVDSALHMDSHAFSYGSFIPLHRPSTLWTKMSISLIAHPFRFTIRTYAHKPIPVLFPIKPNLFRFNRFLLFQQIL